MSSDTPLSHKPDVNEETQIAPSEIDSNVLGQTNFPRTGIGVSTSPVSSKISFSSDEIPIDTSES